MNHQALGVSHIGEVREQLQGVDELPAGFEAALDPEREDRPLALGQVLLCHRVVRARREIGVIHPSDQRVSFEMLRDREGVGAMQVHAQRQGFQALQEQKRVLRRQARPEVAQSFDPALEDKGERTEGFGEDHAVIAGAWFREHGELAVGPVELARVDDDTADRGAVAADELGRGVDDYIRAELDGAAQIRRGKGVVDHQRDTRFVGNLGDTLDVDHVHARIRDGLDIDHLGLLGDRVAEIVEVVRVNENRVVSEPTEGRVELGIGAAVQGGGRDYFVAALAQARDGQQLRGLPAGGCQSSDAAFKRRHPLFEHPRRGVHDAGVDVAKLLQGEERGSVGGVVEDV